MKLFDYSLIPPSITVKRNDNECRITFSSAKDTTQLMRANNKGVSFDVEKHVSYSLEHKPLRKLNEDDYNALALAHLHNDDMEFSDVAKFCEKKEVKNNRSMSSLYRTRSTVYDLANSNPWEHFATITINPEIAEREGIDLSNVRHVQQYVSHQIKNINKTVRYAQKPIKYLLIPEYHQNGNVHLHGFFMNISPFDIKHAINNQEFLKTEDKKNFLFDDFGHKIPNKYYLQPLMRTDVHGELVDVYNCDIFDAIGHNDLEKIQNINKASSYITKYITKDLQSRADEFKAHLYFCSKGLVRSKVVFREKLEKAYMPTFEDIDMAKFTRQYIYRNDYATVLSIPTYDYPKFINWLNVIHDKGFLIPLKENSVEITKYSQHNGVVSSPPKTPLGDVIPLFNY